MSHAFLSVEVLKGLLQHNEGYPEKDQAIGTKDSNTTSATLNQRIHISVRENLQENLLQGISLSILKSKKVFHHTDEMKGKKK